jgi:sulfur transfer complex TusBCD TusB component (DsrH family)
MGKRVLQVIESAYRATIEEQDDTVVWITHAMKGAGADLTVLLCGNAVNYAVADQSSAGLAFGQWQQVHPPQLEQDLARLVDKGVPVFLLQEDLVARGIEPSELIGGVQTLARDDVPRFYGAFDHVWRW